MTEDLANYLAPGDATALRAVEAGLRHRGEPDLADAVGRVANVAELLLDHIPLDGPPSAWRNGAPLEPVAEERQARGERQAMTRATPTPGPWRLEALASRGRYELATVYNVTPQPTEDGLGQGWIYVTAPWDYPDTEEERRARRLADARVMAAGLALLEAVEALVAEVERAEAPVSVAHVAFARAAIAQARGEDAP